MGLERLPRGKAVVPAQFADRLWNMVHAKNSDVQIISSNAGQGKKQLEQMVATGWAEYWPAPKLTAVGDTVLFYVEEPVSAILALGKATSGAKATSLESYEARIGKVRLLNPPITRAELRTMFPDWAWLRSVNNFAYVSPERASSLKKRAIKSLATSSEQVEAVGAGFGNAKTSAIVEMAAIRKVTKRL